MSPRINGKLVADFTSFFQAVKESAEKLDGLEANASTAAARLKSMAESFSGSKIIQQATIAVAALNEIGDTTKLTTAEQVKLNKLVSEAIEKYNALGQQAPADMVAIKNATQGAADSMEKTGGLGAQAGQLLAGAFAVDKIKGFASTILDTADKVQKFADQAGITTDEVQNLNYIAGQTGVSAEGMVSAIQNLTDKLGSGDTGATGAMEKLKINTDDFLKLDPYQAFMKLAEGINAIQDPTEKAKRAHELFGKSWKEIMPAVIADMKEMEDQAPKMSDATIKSLDAAGDKLQELHDRLIVWGGNVVDVLSKIPDYITISLSDVVSEYAAKIGVLAGILGKFASTVSPTLGAGLTALSKEFLSTAQYYHNVSEAQIAQLAKLESQSNKTGTALGHLGDRNKKGADEAKKHADEIKKLTDSLSGADLVKKMKDLDEAVSALKGTGPLTGQSLTNIAKAAQDLFDKGVKLSPQLWEIVATFGDLGPKLNTSALDFHHLGEEIAIVPPKLDEVWKKLETIHEGITPDFWRNLTQIPKPEIPKPPPPEVFAKIFDFSQVGASLTNAIIGAVQGGKASDIIGSAAGGIGSTVGTNIAKNLTAEGGKLFNTALGSVISGALPIVGGLVGPLAGKIADALFGTAGRDAVKKFAESFGGFDELHKTLGEKLPADAERFWIKLTQQTGRNDLKGAQKTIEEIQAALAKVGPTIDEQIGQAGYKTKDQLRQIAESAVKVYETMRDSGQYTAADVQKAWQAARDALIATGSQTAIGAQKATDAIKQLDDQIKGLQDSIANEAPEEEMGVIEKQTRAQIDALQKQQEAAQKQMDEAAKAAQENSDESFNHQKDNLDENKDEWQKWQDDVLRRLGIVGSAITSLPKPTVPGSVPGFAGGTGGQYLDFGAGTLAILHGRERVSTPGEETGGTQHFTVQIGNDVIARAAVRGMPRQFTLQGL